MTSSNAWKLIAIIPALLVGCDEIPSSLQLEEIRDPIRQFVDYAILDDRDVSPIDPDSPVGQVLADMLGTPKTTSGLPHASDYANKFHFRLYVENIFFEMLNQLRDKKFIQKHIDDFYETPEAYVSQIETLHEALSQLSEKFGEGLGDLSDASNLYVRLFWLTTKIHLTYYYSFLDAYSAYQCAGKHVEKYCDRSQRLSNFAFRKLSNLDLFGYLFSLRDEVRQMLISSQKIGSPDRLRRDPADLFVLLSNLVGPLVDTLSHAPSFPAEFSEHFPGEDLYWKPWKKLSAKLPTYVPSELTREYIENTGVIKPIQAHFQYLLDFRNAFSNSRMDASGLEQANSVADHDARTLLRAIRDEAFPSQREIRKYHSGVLADRNSLRRLSSSSLNVYVDIERMTGIAAVLYVEPSQRNVLANQILALSQLGRKITGEFLGYQECFYRTLLAYHAIHKLDDRSVYHVTSGYGGIRKYGKTGAQRLVGALRKEDGFNFRHFKHVLRRELGPDSAEYAYAEALILNIKELEIARNLNNYEMRQSIPPSFNESMYYQLPRSFHAELQDRLLSPLINTCE